MKMENLDFLKTKRFSRLYSVLTNAVLSLGLVFGLFGILGNLLLQTVSGFLTLSGVILLFGQIVLVLRDANKESQLGWILVRFAYVTLFVMILGMLSITIGSVISTFYLLGGNSLQATILFSSVGFTSLTCFGIGLSGVCYHTLIMEEIWNIT
jgi:hypothetical protein